MQRLTVRDKRAIMRAASNSSLTARQIAERAGVKNIRLRLLKNYNENCNRNLGRSKSTSAEEAGAQIGEESYLMMKREPI